MKKQFKVITANDTEVTKVNREYAEFLSKLAWRGYAFTVTREDRGSGCYVMTVEVPDYRG